NNSQAISLDNGARFLAEPYRQPSLDQESSPSPDEDRHHESRDPQLEDSRGKNKRLKGKWGRQHRRHHHRNHIEAAEKILDSITPLGSHTLERGRARASGDEIQKRATDRRAHSSRQRKDRHHRMSICA